MNIHLVFTTRMLLRKLGKEGLEEQFKCTAEDICGRHEATLLDFEHGIRSENGTSFYTQSAVHIHIHLHGQTAPAELYKEIKTAFNTITSIEDPSKRSIWNNDYYITDDKYYEPEKAIAFVSERLAKYKPGGRNK